MAVAGDVLFGLAGGTQRLGGLHDRVVVLAHGLGGHVGVHARTVPVTLHGLGGQADLDLVILAGAVQQVASQPDLIADGECVDGADLELPLPRHDLGVGARDVQARLDAPGGVLLDDVAAVDAQRAHTAVIRTLGAGEPVGREARGPLRDRVEHGVLLLETEPEVLIAVLVEDRPQLGPHIGGVRLHRLGQERLAHHHDVVAAPQRIRAGVDRLQHDIGVAAFGLVGARAVEAPDARLVAVGEDPRLGTHFGRGLGAVGPDVLSPVSHCMLLRRIACTSGADGVSPLARPSDRGGPRSAGPAGG